MIVVLKTLVKVINFAVFFLNVTYMNVVRLKLCLYGAINCL